MLTQASPVATCPICHRSNSHHQECMLSETIWKSFEVPGNNPGFAARCFLYTGPEKHIEHLLAGLTEIGCARSIILTLKNKQDIHLLLEGSQMDAIIFFGDPVGEDHSELMSTIEEAGREGLPVFCVNSHSSWGFMTQLHQPINRTFGPSS